LHLAPLFVRKACCRCSPFSLLRSVVCRWRGCLCALAILIVRLAFVVVDRRLTIWWCSCSRRHCRGRPEMKCLAYPSQDSSKYEWKKGENYTKCTLTDVENGSMITQWCNKEIAQLVPISSISHTYTSKAYGGARWG
jgi:hypothetical protein